MPRAIDSRSVPVDRLPTSPMGGPIPDQGWAAGREALDDPVSFFIKGLLQQIKDVTGIDLFWMLDWSWTTNTILELVRQANDLMAWLQNPIQRPPNLLSRPSFSSPSAIAAAPDWFWDAVVSVGTVAGPDGRPRTDPQGSARTTADGVRHALLSNPISGAAVAAGQILTCQMRALVEDGFTAADDQAICLELVPSRAGVLGDPVVLAHCGVPTDDPTDWIAAPVGSKAVFFDVDYRVPTEDVPDTIELRVVVSESADGDVPVRFDGARVAAAGGFLVVLADLFDAGREYLTDLWTAITDWLADMSAWSAFVSASDAAWELFVKRVKRALRHADAESYVPPSTSGIISDALKNNPWFGWLFAMVDDWLQPVLTIGKAATDFGDALWQAVTVFAAAPGAAGAWSTLTAAITAAWNTLVDAVLDAWGSPKTHADFASPGTATEAALKNNPVIGWVFELDGLLDAFVDVAKAGWDSLFGTSNYAGSFTDAWNALMTKLGWSGAPTKTMGQIGSAAASSLLAGLWQPLGDLSDLITAIVDVFKAGWDSLFGTSNYAGTFTQAWSALMTALGWTGAPTKTVSQVGSAAASKLLTGLFDPSGTGQSAADAVSGALTPLLESTAQFACAIIGVTAKDSGKNWQQTLSAHLAADANKVMNMFTKAVEFVNAAVAYVVGGFTESGWTALRAAFDALRVALGGSGTSSKTSAEVFSSMADNVLQTALAGIWQPIGDYLTELPAWLDGLNTAFGDLSDALWDYLLGGDRYDGTTRAAWSTAAGGALEESWQTFWAKLTGQPAANAPTPGSAGASGLWSGISSNFLQSTLSSWVHSITDPIDGFFDTVRKYINQMIQGLHLGYFDDSWVWVPSLTTPTADLPGGDAAMTPGRNDDDAPAISSSADSSIPAAPTGLVAVPWLDLTVSGFPAGTITYAIAAVKSGIEGPATLVKAFAGTLIPPNTSGRVDLAWNSVTGASSYKIYRKVDSTYSATDWRLVASPSTAGTLLSPYQDKTARSGGTVAHPKTDAELAAQLVVDAQDAASTADGKAVAAQGAADAAAAAASTADGKAVAAQSAASTADSKAVTANTGVQAVADGIHQAIQGGTATGTDKTVAAVKSNLTTIPPANITAQSYGVLGYSPVSPDTTMDVSVASASAAYIPTSRISTASAYGDSVGASTSNALWLKEPGVYSFQTIMSFTASAGFSSNGALTPTIVYSDTAPPSSGTWTGSHSLPCGTSATVVDANVRYFISANNTYIYTGTGNRYFTPGMIWWNSSSSSASVKIYAISLVAIKLST